MTDFPRVATLGRGVESGVEAPSPTLIIDTQSEPGAWKDAIPYKFRAAPDVFADDIAREIERDCAARKRLRLARRKAL